MLEQGGLGRTMRKRKVLLLLLLCLCVGCGKRSEETEGQESQNQQENTEEPATTELFAMDTYMTLTAYGENAEEALEMAEQKIEELDRMLSIGNPDSEIAKINTDGKAEVSQDTYDLIDEGLKIWKETDGAFNITMEPLMELWGFTSGDYQVPAQEELEEALKLTDVSEVAAEEENREIFLGTEGMKVDLGGIAKGYTSEKLMEIFREQGIQNAMVSLGGNVQVLGTKPDGSPWRVGIENPDENGGYLGVLETSDRAVITSGGYERYFEEDGVAYHHILDPATGYPADNGYQSVTIISADGSLADALSTALFVLGPEKAEAYWKEHSDSFDAIFLTNEGELAITEGIADVFTSDYEVRIIEK